VKHFHHGLLVDFHHGAIGHCGCGAQAESLPRKATLPKESTFAQDADCCFFPDLSHNGEFYFSFLYVKNSIGRIALSKGRLLCEKRCDLSTPLIVERKVWGSKFMSFLPPTKGELREINPAPQIGPFLSTLQAGKGRLNPKCTDLS
jgi:hypothetical protein